MSVSLRMRLCARIVRESTPLPTPDQALTLTPVCPTSVVAVPIVAAPAAMCLAPPALPPVTSPDKSGAHVGPVHTNGGAFVAIASASESIPACAPAALVSSAPAAAAAAADSAGAADGTTAQSPQLNTKRPHGGPLHSSLKTTAEDSITKRVRLDSSTVQLPASRPSLLSSMKRDSFTGTPLLRPMRDEVVVGMGCSVDLMLFGGGECGL